MFAAYSDHCLDKQEPRVLQTARSAHVPDRMLSDNLMVLCVRFSGLIGLIVTNKDVAKEKYQPFVAGASEVRMLFIHRVSTSPIRTATTIDDNICQELSKSYVRWLNQAGNSPNIRRSEARFWDHFNGSARYY